MHKQLLINPITRTRTRLISDIHATIRLHISLVSDFVGGTNIYSVAWLKIKIKFKINIKYK
jgi:hypothetical protein